VHLLGFRAYINEICGSNIKTPVKDLVRQRCAEGFNFGVKGLNSLYLSFHLSAVNNLAATGGTSMNFEICGFSPPQKSSRQKSNFY
jgi:hypothetical protein